MNEERQTQKTVFLGMILVTGATGLVGAHLCLSLLNKKQPLVALYRREKKRQAMLDFFEQKNQAALTKYIIWRKADLCNLPELTKAFEGITVVYHCAAYVSMAYFKRDYLQVVNQQGTADLVNLCIEHKVKKLAYVSSIAALGSQSSGTIDENTPWNPSKEKTPYAYSKYGAELEVWRASQEGVPVVIVNPGVILGLGMPRSPLEQLIKQIKKGARFYPLGTTGYVAVEDVIDVLVYLINSEHQNERYILVAENWSYKKMMETVAKLINKKSPTKPLKNFGLYCLLVIELLLSGMGLRKRFLSKALVTSLSNQQPINGDKIKKVLEFNYRPIVPYLKDQLKT